MIDPTPAAICIHVPVVIDGDGKLVFYGDPTGDTLCRCPGCGAFSEDIENGVLGVMERVIRLGLESRANGSD